MGRLHPFNNGTSLRICPAPCFYTLCLLSCPLVNTVAGGDTLSSDFSDTGLTIAFQGVTTGVDSLSLTFQSLTPGDFGSVAALTNSFPASTTIGASANTITWTWDGGGPFTTPDFVETFAITAAPEPETFLPMGFGLAAFGSVIRWRRSTLSKRV
jgi:hypothetical protein